MPDHMRPRNPLAARLYDAFAHESKYRDQREFEEWNKKEQEAVWHEAKKIALELGKEMPTLEAIANAESQAAGHSDYGRTWAWQVLEHIQNSPDAKKL